MRAVLGVRERAEDAVRAVRFRIVSFALTVIPNQRPFPPDIAESVLGGAKQHGRAAEPVLKAADMELQKVGCSSRPSTRR